MPQRVLGAWLIVVGLAGLVAVCLWAILGRDVRAAARRGPRWKRLLLAAGLSVLGAFGWSQAAAEAGQPAAAAAETPPRTEADDASEAVLALFRMRAQLEELARLTAARDVNGPAIVSAAVSKRPIVLDPVIKKRAF